MKAKLLSWRTIGCILAILAASQWAQADTTTGAGIGASGTSGSNIPISSGVGAQQVPRVAFGEDADLYLVVWQDFRKGASRIYGQRIFGDGSLMGGNFLVSDVPESAANQFLPSVAYNQASKEFLVVWGDERDMSSSAGNIYGRLVSTKGAFPGADFVISGAPNDQVQPLLACNPVVNECLVVWTDNRAYDDSGSDVWGQLVAGNGVLLGQNFNIAGASGDQARPAVAFDSSTGRFLVVWHDNTVAADGYDIRGQLVAADGTLVRGNFVVASAPGDQLRPAIAYNSQDRDFLVVWYDFRSGSQPDPYAQRISVDGLLLGQNKPIAQMPSGEVAPDLAFDPAGNQYRIVWDQREVSSANTVDTILSVVAAGPGDPVGDKTVISGSAIQPTLPAIAYNSLAREYLVVWQDARNYSISGLDIYGQRVGAGPSPYVVMVPLARKNWDSP